MATNAVQEAWLKSAPGRRIDTDKAYGLQCVDLADDYANTIFPGTHWHNTVGRVNGARDFKGRNNGYIEWVPNIVGDMNSVPRRGDIIVWDGDNLNQYGHVAVVLDADAHTILVVQQDGFLQVPAFVGRLKYDQRGTGPCLGWLRPKVQIDAPVAVAGNQRVVGQYGVNERKQPSKSADIDRVFKPGDTLTFKGFVNNADGLWFVGAFAGTYFHSSAFDDAGTHDLADLTPAPVETLTAAQRKVGAAGATLRTAPDRNGDLVQQFNAGDVLNFVGYVRGTRPYGADSSDIWFVGISGNYVSATTLEDQSVGSLPDMTVVHPSEPAPSTPSEPLPTVQGYSFSKRWQCTTAIAPANIVNMQRGNFSPRPEYLVIHQIDDPSRAPANGDWLSSALSWFQRARPDAPTSAHMIAQAPHFVEVVDSVDRAYHAGTYGNDYLSVELPPNPDAATIELVKQFQREYRDEMGYALKLTRHKDVKGNATACGTHIPLDLFDISAEKPDVPTKTEDPALAVLTREQETTVLANFNDWLTKLFAARKEN